MTDEVAALTASKPMHAVIDQIKVRNGSKSEKLRASICFPLCHRERTLRNTVDMSVSCQQETNALLRKSALFDHLVGDSE
jgi:hypothetical protein